MRFFAVFSSTLLVLGAESFQLGDLEGQLILRSVGFVENSLASLQRVMTDVTEVFTHTKANYYTKGYLVESTEDCLALSNTSQIAYDLAVNATGFIASSVEQIASSLNIVVGCYNTSVLPDTVVICMFNQLRIARQLVLDTEANFKPYMDEAADLYSDIISEIHACIGF